MKRAQLNDKFYNNVVRDIDPIINLAIINLAIGYKLIVSRISYTGVLDIVYKFSVCFELHFGNQFIRNDIVENDSGPRFNAARNVFSECLDLCCCC